jgi:hypothetical protein
MRLAAKKTAANLLEARRHILKNARLGIFFAIVFYIKQNALQVIDVSRKKRL